MRRGAGAGVLAAQGRAGKPEEDFPTPRAPFSEIQTRPPRCAGLLQDERQKTVDPADPADEEAVREQEAHPVERSGHDAKTALSNPNPRQEITRKKLRKVEIFR